MVTVVTGVTGRQIARPVETAKGPRMNDSATTDGIEGAAAETAPGAFAPGDTLLVDGQPFICTGLTPFWSKRQGREISLAVFSSLCPDCGARFEATIKSEIPRALSRVRNRIPRRCPFCRSAGHRVSSVLLVPATETFAASSAKCRATGTHEKDEDESSAGSQGAVAPQSAI